jgi:tetratricopeptide (TPR) repeat protein
MEQDIAQRMLEMCLISPTNEPEVADLLLKDLAYLPLAIVQAAAYININKITLRKYLLLLAEQKEEVVDHISKESENVIASTWLISFEQMRRQDTLAAHDLLFMACVDPTDIPLALLPMTSPCEKGIDAIGTLDAYSFVTKRTAQSALDIHRLVHLSTRNWLKKQESLSEWNQVAITRLLEVFPDDNHGNRSKWRRLLPHAKFALSFGLPGQENEARMNLACNHAVALFSDGRFSEAEEYFNDALQSSRGILGPEHPSTLAIIANLASIYRDQGRWKEAEDLEVQVVETSKRVLGAEHPSTLISMANLALTYQNQGCWKEAKELQAINLEIFSRVLGKEHPSTLTSMANLASIYWNQGYWKEAEELQATVLEICSRVLGKEHPDTLTRMNNLAFVWKGHGRDADALELMKQCTEARARVLGANHPYTLSSHTVLLKWQKEELEISA